MLENLKKKNLLVINKFFSHSSCKLRTALGTNQGSVYYNYIIIHFTIRLLSLIALHLFSTAEDSSLDFFETLRRRYPEAYPLLYTDLIIDFLFMIDILMNFRTTYVKEGEVLITSPWKIAVHYLKTYFVVDFVAAIPWDLLASFNSGTEEVSA